MRGVPVLMYHALEDAQHPAGAADAGEQRYVLQVSQFREQMNYLKCEGYRTFLLEELALFPKLPDKAVVLTFDDGHASNFTLALPLLERFGFRAEFFVSTDRIGTPFFLDRSQIRGLCQAGMKIGSHGVTHRFLTDLMPVDLETELVSSKRILEDCLSGSISSLSYPGGRGDRRTRLFALQAGYREIFTSQPGYLHADTDTTEVSRIPMTGGMSLCNFALLLQGRGLGRLYFRHRLLGGFKSMLGNDRYDALRFALLKRLAGRNAQT